jgi:hypothetical protein
MHLVIDRGDARQVKRRRGTEAREGDDGAHHEDVGVVGVAKLALVASIFGYWLLSHS